jgi:AraC-like DNA-binding protein
VGTRLVHSLLDLVTTMFASELGTHYATADPRHNLMMRIKQHIDSHLSDCDLTPSDIASALFISTRHLHNLFHEEGDTVSSYIRAERLDRCRNDLADHLSADYTVAAIAARWGFPDAAHFSRIFKSRFGYSPSELRSARPV